MKHVPCGHVCLCVCSRLSSREYDSTLTRDESRDLEGRSRCLITDLVIYWYCFKLNTIINKILSFMDVLLKRI
jgi:hypothetical protein